MSLNETPRAGRVHIGIFGRRNAGKSSLINALTGQELAVVSEVKGTTTDPVYKAMELLPLGPVVLIDTPGLDDEGALGEKRVQKSRQVLRKTDIALLVVDAAEGVTEADRAFLAALEELKIPHLLVFNKSDGGEPAALPQGAMAVSAQNGRGIHALRERIATLAPREEPEYPILSDLLSPGDFVVLVIPIDAAAPKGRLILPQQQTIREILEAGATAIAVREFELAATLEKLGVPPRMVVTDSQAFARVAADTSEEISLTSFSILFARHKGGLEEAVRGVRMLDKLRDGDRVLIAEGCTHHRQCDDIGTVKLPNWIREYTGKEIAFSFCSGGEFPEDLTPYRLAVHCGGCMLNQREMRHRVRESVERGLPITNYGIVIARVTGILERSLEVFPGVRVLLEE